MDISIVADLIRKVPQSSWIALSALVISIIGVFISIRKLNYERKLESARKRTELMNRLSDVKRNLKDSLKYCKLSRPISKECKDRWQAHLPNIERDINNIDEAYHELEKLGHNIDPLQFERITPKIYSLLISTKSDEDTIKELLEMCLSCPANKPESYNDTNSNKR
jgi:hypothetical protein